MTAAGTPDRPADLTDADDVVRQLGRFTTSGISDALGAWVGKGEPGCR